MRSSALSLRPLAYVLVAAGLAVPVLDAGSIMLTHFSVNDGVRISGQAAAEAIEELPTSRATAFYAHEVAEREADSRDLDIDLQDFVIFPDGRVTLTGSRTAPTVLLGRLGFLGDAASVTATMTVQAPSL